MSVFAPFRAVRPAPGLAEQMVSLPYDVVSREEATALGAANPYSYLHVVRADGDVAPEIDMHAPAVHAQARETWRRWLAESILVLDDAPTYTIYREHQDGRSQVGIVGCASIDEYLDGTIARHEVTLVEKERDRITHFDTVDAHTEPIWLAHRPSPALAAIIDRYVRDAADVDVADPQGVRHELWRVSDADDIAAIREAFAALDRLYIADGHHRAASAVKVGLERRARGAGAGPHDYVLAVACAGDQLHIMDYNRVVTDLGDLDACGLVAAAREAGFRVTASADPVRPRAPREFGMYVGGTWYVLTAPATPDREGADDLDVSLLHDLLLEPVLGIVDPRTDSRIDFVGGIRGLAPLVAAADASGGAAFTIPPVTMETIMTIADRGEIMPPKSTWFEPKLGSGLFAHALDDVTTA
ncbi:DUF1015 domain-containing protein [Nanchangia anserum]|uniref:DUF1015 domain-containing protein n=1 Tax=Nanchangia anserum TaxID=2692125 RepID=A0A8I0KV13_9ACTO|nr:DUF1015 family protein [Nanchangia anserum]MBD3690263.1 DUF1015 domain-containing protein [Nanchangia anserum]QOX82300.1 DUF1015 domain-containing protein [Nanchangia anserum]